MDFGPHCKILSLESTEGTGRLKLLGCPKAKGQQSKQPIKVLRAKHLSRPIAESP